VETAPAFRPVVITREGTLTAGQRVAVDFGLLGPNRIIRLAGAFPRSGARGRIALSCDGGLDRHLAVGPAQPVTTLVVPRAGPGQCTASIASTGTAAQRFRFTVRLTVRG
jgi:hypothetical protein